jgi:hypothetical protein
VRSTTADRATVLPWGSTPAIRIDSVTEHRFGAIAQWWSGLDESADLATVLD